MNHCIWPAFKNSISNNRCHPGHLSSHRIAVWLCTSHAQKEITFNVICLGNRILMLRCLLGKKSDIFAPWQCRTNAHTRDFDPCALPQHKGFRFLRARIVIYALNENQHRRVAHYYRLPTGFLKID